jgi:hypothetical protein
MTLTKCGGLKAASASLVVLFTLAAYAPAQAPRKGASLTRAERDEWYKILRWPAMYEDAWRKEPESLAGGGLSFYGLGRGKYLVEVHAYVVPYQTGYLYMLYDDKHKPDGPGRLLLLRGFETEDARGRRLPYSEVSAVATKFHSKTKVLEVVSKYRAAGDCGLYARYRFVGPRPVVLETRERECGLGGRGPARLDWSRWPRKKL